MNISPHHQRPTKYPWPGNASAAAVVIALALVVFFIGFMLLKDSSTNDNSEVEPTGMWVVAPQGFW